MTATGRGAQVGVLVRDAEALERLARWIRWCGQDRDADDGQAGAGGGAAAAGFDEGALLRLAAGLERGSEHPLARRSCRERSARDRAGGGVRLRGGDGAGGAGDGRGPGGGARECADDGGAGSGPAFPPEADARRDAGETVMAVVVDGRPAGMISVADRSRRHGGGNHGAPRRGLRIVMATGDNARTARGVGGAARDRRSHADVLPRTRRGSCESGAGRRVAMAGDGVMTRRSGGGRRRNRNGDGVGRGDGGGQWVRRMERAVSASRSASLSVSMPAVSSWSSVRRVSISLSSPSSYSRSARAKPPMLRVPVA